MEVTEKALYIGIEQAQVGNRVGDIGAAMDEYITQFGYKMSLDFSGHGLGPTIHEEPMVPFVGVYGTGAKLKEGMVITVEPIVNESSPYAKLDDNGRTARTNNGCLSCQYEHTFAITKDGPFITTKQNKTFVHSPNVFLRICVFKFTSTILTWNGFMLNDFI